MQKFNIKFIVNYEGYSGYDHTGVFTYTTEGRNSDSAVNKAKKLLKKNAGAYLARGSIRNILIYSL